MRGLATIASGALRRESRPGVHRGLAAAPRRVEVDLSPQATERIAARVSQLLAERKDEETPKLISAGELALRLGVERPWVYRHRHLLGGIRMGAGPKAPWRFDYVAAIEAMLDLQSGPDSGERWQ
jgi:hypothetical protein